MYTHPHIVPLANSEYSKLAQLLLPYIDKILIILTRKYSNPYDFCIKFRVFLSLECF